MTIIDNAISSVLANEGGYVNNPADRGGATNFGITEAVARKNGFTGDMRSMPREFAIEVYRRQYVVAPGFDRVAALSVPIAGELVDTGVNMGPTVATRFLQRALSLLTSEALVQDGHIGPVTLAALRDFLDRRGAEGERRLLALLNAFQGTRYAELAEGRAQNREFIYGWLSRIVPEAA
ncbi:glycosyl hydrolase 108 family protein [Sphingomonas sp.]|uniref:glycoside hydrolase family 108 protein n=1 Tax=Sphingomonas sp. TaxID=28214 RepID=UPI0025803CAC|nr:glycosyl hydrolase 108 family protein [Sphingomonas sp.]